MSLVVRILTNCRRRKRVYNVVILIAIACVLILCFQFFLFGAITVYQDEQFTANRFDRGARPKFIDDEFGFDMAPVHTVKPAANIKLKTAKISEKCVGGNCSAYHTTERKDNTVAPEMNVKSLVSYSNVWVFLEHEFSTNHQIAQVNSTYTRGVNARWQPFYVKDETGFFTCIMSHEEIPFSQVNDDYCDCSDHSDEPGTSACSNGRFYCLFQSTFLSDNPVWVPSSRVNDGLCDCCDGSDEWANHTVQQPVTGVTSIVHAPCVDRCHDLRLKEKQMEELRQEGKVKKQDYIKAGMGQSNPDELYGTDAVFFKLRTVCLNFQHGKYSYSICPFGPVSQTAAGGSSVVIGQRPHWIDRGPKYRLALEDGVSTNCPALLSRRTLVDFECGVEDRVLSVSENEVCQYLVRFSTPAAC